MHFIFSVLAKQRVYDASSFTLWPLLIHECFIEDKQKMKRMVFLWLNKFIAWLLYFANTPGNDCNLACHTLIDMT